MGIPGNVGNYSLRQDMKVNYNKLQSKANYSRFNSKYLKGDICLSSGSSGSSAK